MAKDNLVLLHGGSRGHGKTFRMLTHFISQIKSGKKTVMLGGEYVVMSRKGYENLCAKAAMAFKRGK